MSVDYAKLKTNLNLIMHRLKLVEKKKMENNQKARRTIGEFLNAGKADRARIRVEQIIREDYIVEAMDLVESYCDLLVSRFGQIKETETVDDSLATAISSLIWVTPRFEVDVPELKAISEQLGRKYGKQYVEAVRENRLKTVNDILIKKLGMAAPPRVLVEKYLVEIAKDQKIDYKPDPKVLKEHEAAGYRPSVADSSDDDDDTRGGGQLRRPAEGVAPQSGFNLIDLGDHYPRNPITQPYTPYTEPPPLPSEPPMGAPSWPAGPVDSLVDTTDASAPSADLPIGFNLPGPEQPSTSSPNQSSSVRLTADTAPSDKTVTPSAKKPTESQPAGTSEGPPPNYDSVVNKPGRQPANQTMYYSFGADSSFGPQQHHHSRDDLNDTLPELPPVPSDHNDGPTPDRDERPSMEDLTKRFEELRNKRG